MTKNKVYIYIYIIYIYILRVDLLKTVRAPPAEELTGLLPFLAREAAGDRCCAPASFAGASKGGFESGGSRASGQGEERAQLV